MDKRSSRPAPVDRPRIPESTRPAPRTRRKKQTELTCLLTPLPRGKALSLALVHYLSDEITDVRFTLDAREKADAVWVCGYADRAAGFLERLRAQHPTAMIVVTGRAPAMTWGKAALKAGADYACSWPVDYCLLGRILHTSHVTEVGVNRLLEVDPPRNPFQPHVVDSAREI